MFVVINAGIQLKAYQQAVGIKIIPQHNHHQCANGAIHGIVAHKITHKQRERHRGEDSEGGGNRRANAPKAPLVSGGGSVIINERCRHIKKKSDEHPVDSIKKYVHGFPAGMVKVNKNVNEVFAQNDEGNGNQQCYHEQYGDLKRYPIPVGNTSSPEVGMVLIKSRHQRAHTAGTVEQDKQQPNRQQSPAMMMQNIFNSIMGGIIGGIGHHRFNRMQQCGGETINGYISNHGKQKNNSRKSSQQKVESDRGGANINRIALGLPYKKGDYIIYRLPFKTGNGEGVPPLINAFVQYSLFNCFKPVAHIKLKPCNLFPMQSRFINIHIARFFIFKCNLERRFLLVYNNGCIVSFIICGA
jgi:hypothetical protein